MKHVFSDRFNREQLGLKDKYHRIWVVLVWLIGAIALVAMGLQFIPATKALSSPAIIISFTAYLLLMLVFFIIRIVKNKVFDWMYIFIIVLTLLVLSREIINTGGLCAVFSAT